MWEVERPAAFAQALRRQAAMHPALQPQDALKLCYQSAWGAEHLLADLQAAARYFEEEYARVTPRHEPLAESIGPGQYRVNLAAWKQAGLPAEWLLRMFAAAAQSGAERQPQQGEKALADALEQVRQAAQKGELPFDEAAWLQTVARWKAAGGGAVHHSDGYRKAEAPAYRVVSAPYVRLLPLLVKMAQLAEAGPGPRVIAIDGRSASGKSTMARQLAAITGAGVVQMDDFFLPPELRTPQRYAQPGGNVHHERFAQQVLPQLRSGEAFAYQRFDCGTLALGPWKQVEASRWRVVEGAYSCHPILGEYMDLRVFSDIAPEEQLARVRVRNGEEQAKVYAERWIPLEEAYLSAYSIEQAADLTL